MKNNEYKKAIHKMVDQINNNKILESIFKFIYRYFIS